LARPHCHPSPLSPGKAVYSKDVVSRKSYIYNKLTNNRTNIRYAAAYIAMIQDIWEEEYPEIEYDIAIVATLYNIGENGTTGVNSKPKSNPFGQYAQEHYTKMQHLLGVEE